MDPVYRVVMDAHNNWWLKQPNGTLVPIPRERYRMQDGLPPLREAEDIQAVRARPIDVSPGWRLRRLVRQLRSRRD